MSIILKMVGDAYERLGEFHDLFMDTAWSTLRPTLELAFADLAGDAVIVDLGAGTGIGTRELAGCTPAQIVAIEPSLTMRSALLTRVVDSPVLRQRVSVLAGRVPEALDQLPPIDGFVCAHMLGHLAPADRAATFARLADLLAPNGRGVVVVNSASTSTASVSEERPIGRYRYLARHLPSGDSSGYVSEYQVLDGDTVLRSETFTGTWERITLDTLAAELAPAGLTITPHLDGVGIVGHRSS